MLSKLLTTRFDYLWIGLFAGLLIFFNLGAARLFDEDEPKNAECGVSEFSARLPSALMALGTMWSVYVMGRHLFDRLTGMVAACALGSCLMYVTIARASTPDSTLIFFIVLSLAMYVVWSLPVATGERNQSSPQPPESALAWPSTYLPKKNWQFIVMYAVMGCAVLSKGPVGFLLPCSIIGLTLLWMGFLEQTDVPVRASRGLIDGLMNGVRIAIGVFSPVAFVKAVLGMRVWWLALSLVVVALPWYVAVGIATDGAWLEGFLGGHNVGRFLKPMEQHSGPFFYYIPVILMGFFPWSAFLPLALVDAGLEVKNEKVGQGHAKSLVGYVFLLSWVMIYLVFFSIAQTKLPNYVLPCYPALALVTAALLVRWVRGEMQVPVRFIRWGAYSWMAAGVALSVGLTIAGGVVLQGAYWLGLVGVVPFLGGLVLLWQERQPTYLSDIKLGRLPTVIAFSGIFVLAAINLAADPISALQDGPHYGQLSRELAGDDRRLGTYEFFSPNLVFYGEKQVVRIHDVEELARFLKDNEGGMVLTRSDKYDEFKDKLPTEIVIADRRPRFLRQHDLLLLVHRESQIAKREQLSIFR